MGLFFSVATQLGEILFFTESSVSLKNIKSMTDLLSIGFPKDPGIPWSLLNFTVGSTIWFKGGTETLFLQCQVPQRWWGCADDMLTLWSLPNLPNRNVRAAALLCPLTGQRRGHQSTFILQPKKETLQTMYLLTHDPMCASATAFSVQNYVQTFWNIHLYSVAFQDLSRLEDTDAL